MAAVRERLRRVGRAMITDYRGVTVAVATAIVVFAIVYGPRLVRSVRGAPDVAGPWADAARCLVGELRADDTPGARYRDVELARGIEVGNVMSVDTGAIVEGSWPHTCLPAVEALANAAVDADMTEVADAAKSIAASLGTGMSASTSEIETLWSAATGALGPPGASDLPDPGAPRVPRGLAPFAETTRGHGTYVTSGPVHMVPFKAYRGCVVGEGDPAVSCFSYPDAIPRRPLEELRPVQTDHPADVFVDVERPAEDGGGIYSLATGERVLATGAARYTAMVAADGRAAAVAWDPARRDSAYLAVRHPDGTTARVPLDARIGKPDVAWSWLVYDLPGTEGRRRIVARRITWSDPPLGPVVELGSRPAWSRGELAMCVDGERVFTLYHGGRDEAGSAVMSLGEDGAWMHAVEHAGHLSCDGGVARVVSVTTGDWVAVRESRCDADGCRDGEVALEGIDVSESDHVTAVALGEEIAFVWLSNVVRARIAPLPELPTAPDTVIYDGFAGTMPRNYASLVHEIHAARAGDAVLVRIETEGAQAVRLERDGTVVGLGVVRVQTPPTASPR